MGRMGPMRLTGLMGLTLVVLKAKNAVDLHG